MYNSTITELRPSGSPQKRIAPQTLFEFVQRDPPALHSPLPDRAAKARLRLTPATASALSDSESMFGEPVSRAQTPASVASAPATSSACIPPPLADTRGQRPATSNADRRRYQYPDGKKTNRLPPVLGELTANPKKFHANNRNIVFNKSPAFEVRHLKAKEKEQAEKAKIALTREGRGWKMNHRTRKHALETLARIGPVAAEHAEVVARYTDDDDWVVRKAAAEALGSMGHGAGAQAPRVAALLGDPSLQCRKAAVEALAQMGENADASFSKVVGRMIGNGHGSCDLSANVRWAALTHLPAMGF